MKFIYLLLPLVVAAGCAPFKPAVSDDLQAEHDEFTVKGRQGLLIKEKLSFGNYTTTAVQRSWTRSFDPRTGISGRFNRRPLLDFISMDYVDKKQSLHFGMSDGALSSQVFCVSRFNAMDLAVGNNTNSLFNIGLDLAGLGQTSNSTYYVQVYNDHDGIPWQLLLDNKASQTKARTYTGVFARTGKEYYTISPITRLEKKGKVSPMPFGSIGFEIRNASGRTVAAVSAMDKGWVMLAKTNLEERFLLANLCAAILLQEQIEN